MMGYGGLIDLTIINGIWAYAIFTKWWLAYLKRQGTRGGEQEIDKSSDLLIKVMGMLAE